MWDRLCGTSLGDYQLESLIGRGGVARVYRAVQASLGRTVAVKVFEQTDETPPDILQRFLREASLLAGLEHPNIVPVYGAGHEGDLYYYAMQLLDTRGQTLADALPTLALPRGLRHMAAIAGALGYAHDRGVIHRDVKPLNILLADSSVKLVDFGLARALADSTITTSGMLMGTPLYFAPEQARFERATARSDIFALGTTLYELATARHPFRESRPEDIFATIARCNPPSPRLLKPELHPDLERVILTAMQRDPSARYASAHQLRAELLDLYPRV